MLYGRYCPYLASELSKGFAGFIASCNGGPLCVLLRAASMVAFAPASVWALCGEHEPCYGELGELNWNKSMDGLGWTSWLQISISADVALASARAGWSIHQFTQHGGEDA